MPDKIYLIGIAIVVCFASTISAQTAVELVSPASHALNAGANESIIIHFKGEGMISANTLKNNIFIYGSHSGLHKREDIEVIRDVENKIAWVNNLQLKSGELVSVIIREVREGNFYFQPYQWQFSVRPESGTGEFKRRVELNLAPPSQPVSVFAADLNNSLLSDLAVLDAETGTVSVFENTATSTGIGFNTNPVREVPVPAGVSGTSQFTHITGGDLHANGFVSLVVTSYATDEIIIHANHGEGNFNFHSQKIKTGNRPVMSIVGDFNNDSKMDIAVLASGSNQVMIHFNKNDFRDPTPHQVGSQPTSMVARDFDNNGYMDIAVAISEDKSIELLKNKGMESNGDNSTVFYDAAPIIENLTFQPGILIAGNFAGKRNNGEYGNEFVELAVGSHNSNVLELYAFDINSNGFSWKQKLEPSKLTHTANIAAGDFFGNTVLDLVTTYRDDPHIDLFKNSENESFLPAFPVDPEIPSNIPFGVGLAVADFANNGSVDIAVTNAGYNKVTVLYNQGGSSVPPPGNEPIRAWPNPFTPNNDGYNDRTGFYMGAAEVQNPVLEVYNFEGRRIRTNRNIENQTIFWDGKNDNGNEQLPGVYIYIVKDGSEAIASGIVTLAR